jgi:hypothetical protein
MIRRRRRRRRRRRSRRRRRRMGKHVGDHTINFFIISKTGI